MTVQKFISFTVAVLLSGWSLYAQSVQVTGLVKDENGEPLVGVVVADPANTNAVTITDENGRYSIQIAADGELQFAMIGYITQNVKLSGRKEINISLKPDIQQLESAVAIGYGSAAKKDLTGAIAVVDSKELQNTPTSNVSQMLQGKVTGLEVMSANGEVGESAVVQMRGVRSLSAGNGPLIVVDGVMDAVTDIGEINPADIESISFLKDVSSTAIYGSRGANGVILITTSASNKNKDTKLSVILKSTTGVSHIAGSIDLMDATDFARFQNMVRVQNYPNVALTPQNEASNYPFANPEAEGKGTDWIKLLSQTGIYNDQYARLQINTGSTTLVASLGYNYTQGVILGSNYDRYTARISSDTQITKHVKMGLQASYIFYDVNRTGAAVTGTNSNAAIYLNPLLDKDAIFNRFGFEESVGNIFDNPYLRAKNVTNIAKKWILNIAPWVEANFKKGFSLRSQLSYARENHNNDRYSPSYMPVAQANKSGAFASRSYDKYLRVNWETTLRWKRSFRKHNLEALAGYTLGQNTTETAIYYGTGYIDDDIKYYDMSSIVNSANFLGGSSFKKKTYMSVLGRLSYNYDRKYYLTLTARGDGASNFSTNRKWGFFPSLSLRWSIFNEDFMSGIDWISDLSLRAGLGRSGNDAISSYLTLSLVDPKNGSWVFGDRRQLSSAPSRIENSNLTWETTDAVNAGLNFSVLNSRISVEADFYLSKTRDLLMSAKLSQTTGFSSYFCNMGDTKNMGFEIKLDTRNVKVNNFSWNTTLTLSHNRQLVSDSASGDEVVPVYMNPSNATQYMYGYKSGYPVNALWGYRYGGVWHNQEELDRNAVTHKYASVIKDGANGSNVGRAKYYDLNGDGNLNEADMTYLGTTDPIIYGGFQNEFKFFEKLTLGVYFTYSLGGKMYNISELKLGGTSAYGNHFRYVLDAWHATRNPNSDIPKAGYEDSLASDRHVHDASYFRLKNVTLSYNVNLARYSKTFKTLKIGVTGENLFLLKNYNGFDPDVSSGSSTRRIDAGSFPRSRTYTLNLQLNF